MRKKSSQRLSPPWPVTSKNHPVVLPRHAEKFLAGYENPATYRSCRSALANLQRFAGDQYATPPQISVALRRLPDSCLADFYRWLRRYRYGETTLRRQLWIVGNYFRWLREKHYLTGRDEKRLIKMWLVLEARSGWRRLSILPMPWCADRFLLRFKHPDTRRSYRTALISFQDFAEASGLTDVDCPLAPQTLPADALVKYYRWLRCGGRQGSTIHRYLIHVGRYLRWLGTSDLLSSRFADRVEKMWEGLTRARPAYWQWRTR